MLAVLILLLVSVPLLELFVIVQVADGLGAGQTILLLLVVSVVGAWMVRRSGLGVLRQIRTRLAEGEIPGKELVDGLLILLAGAFMLTPGFLTDAAGLLMLFRPTRAVVRSMLMRRYGKRIDIGPINANPANVNPSDAAGWPGAPGGHGGTRRFGTTLDAESFTADADEDRR